MHLKREPEDIQIYKHLPRHKLNKVASLITCFCLLGPLILFCWPLSYPLSVGVPQHLPLSLPVLESLLVRLMYSQNFCHHQYVDHSQIGISRPIRDFLHIPQPIGIYPVICLASLPRYL